MFIKGVCFFFLDSTEPAIDDYERMYHDTGIKRTLLLDFKHY